MSWNYRVFHSVWLLPDGSTEDLYEIREMYYDADGRIIACSSQGIHPSGSSLEELIADLTRMIEDGPQTIVTARDVPGYACEHRELFPTESHEGLRNQGK